MTYTSPPAYPAEYYHPEFIESRTDDPRLSPPAPPLSTAVATIVNRSTKPKKNLAIDVVTDHGLPDTDITELVKTDPKKSLIRDPVERNIPRLIVDENVLKQAIRTPTFPVTNLDDNETIDSKKTPTKYPKENRPNQTKPIASMKKSPHQIVKVVEDEPPIDEYWKKELLIDDEGVVNIEVRLEQ